MHGKHKGNIDNKPAQDCKNRKTKLGTNKESNKQQVERNNQLSGNEIGGADN